MLAADIRATFDGDPAAKTTDEIVYSYPGLQAVAVYRWPNRLFQLDVPMSPAHDDRAHDVRRGIDIHPERQIGWGSSSITDGVVIGETTQIGKRAGLPRGHAGCTLPPEKTGDQYRGKKCHSLTIEDDVIIYSGATILGGDTVIRACLFISAATSG